MSHALLSPSKAKQWLNCPPSIRLTEHMPGSETGASIEGTTAHALAELMITNKIKALPQKEYKERYKAIYDQQYPAGLPAPYVGQIVNGEMLELCDQYSSFVVAQYNAALKLDSAARIYLEVKADLSDYIQQGFGFLDVVIISHNFIHVIDLKYGKGVLVEADDNDQLRIYGLGALAAFMPIFEIEQVVMTIYQPRMDNIHTVDCSAQELLDWGANWVKPQAVKAYKGEGEFKAGKHCKWCKAARTCVTKMEYEMQTVDEFPTNPQLLNEQQITFILGKAKEFKNWVDSVEEVALEQALQGRKFPGYKLVEGKSNRIFKDTFAIAEALKKFGLPAEKIWQEPKLYGITELEKTVGKKLFSEQFGAYLHKPPGKPALVHESDKRDEYNSADRDFADEL